MGRRRREAETAGEEELSYAGMPWWMKWLPVALALAAADALLVLWAFRPLADPDLWFHMAFGREVLRTGALPATDAFSLTAEGARWISSGWLPGVWFEWLFTATAPGGAGVQALVCLVALGAAGLMVWGMRRCGGAHWGAVCVLLAAGLFASALRWSPRPDLFSLPLLAAFVLILQGMRRSREWEAGDLVWWAWALPVLMLAWANVHAGFLAGAILVLIFGVCAGWERLRGASTPMWGLAGVLGLTLIAWLGNPYGWSILELAARIRAIPGVDVLVIEWVPLWQWREAPLPWPVVLGYLALAGAWVWVLAARRDRMHTWELAAAGFLLLFALLQRRQLGLAGVGVPLLLAPAFAPLRGGALFARPQVMWACAGPLAAGVVLQLIGAFGLGGGMPRVGVNCRDLPCGVVGFLRETRPEGKLFNSYGAGGFLLYHLAPDYRVFMDGRLDLYPREVWLEFLGVMAGIEPPERVIEKYGVSIFALTAEEDPEDRRSLPQVLSRHADFALVFFDDDNAVFVRRTDDNAAWVAVHEFRYIHPYRLEELQKALREPEPRREAIAEAARALQLSGGSASALALAGLIAVSGNDDRSALQYHRDAAGRDPKNHLVRELEAALGLR